MQRMLAWPYLLDTVEGRIHFAPSLVETIAHSLQGKSKIIPGLLRCEMDFVNPPWVHAGHRQCAPGSSPPHPHAEPSCLLQDKPERKRSCESMLEPHSATRSLTRKNSISGTAPEHLLFHGKLGSLPTKARCMQLAQILSSQRRRATPSSRSLEFQRQILGKKFAVGSCAHRPLFFSPPKKKQKEKKEHIAVDHLPKEV